MRTYLLLCALFFALGWSYSQVTNAKLLKDTASDAEMFKLACESEHIVIGTVQEAMFPEDEVKQQYVMRIQKVTLAIDRVLKGDLQPGIHSMDFFVSKRSDRKPGEIGNINIYSSGELIKGQQGVICFSSSSFPIYRQAITRGYEIERRSIAEQNRSVLPIDYADAFSKILTALPKLTIIPQKEPMVIGKTLTLQVHIVNAASSLKIRSMGVGGSYILDGIDIVRPFFSDPQTIRPALPGYWGEWVDARILKPKDSMTFTYTAAIEGPYNWRLFDKKLFPLTVSMGASLESMAEYGDPVQPEQVVRISSPRIIIQVDLPNDMK